MKGTLKKVSMATVLILIMSLTSSFMVKQNSTAQNRVMIYGVVYNDKQCPGGEASIAYATKMVSSDSYAVKTEFQNELKASYPNSTRVRVSSSSYDYSSSATNSCVISWMKTNNNCSYKVISVLFGKTQQEALDKAIKHKNTWAGSNTNYTIEEQKYW